MARNKKLDIVFILDKSGSMSHLRDDTIGGYNNYIEDYKDKNARVTTVLFDSSVSTLYVDKEIKEVPVLTSKEYCCSGCTALLDAIGLTLEKIDKKNKKNVLFVITTDGCENASKEYTKKDIAKKIKEHSDSEFIFIGSDLNSFNDAREFGIKETNMIKVDNDSNGIRDMFYVAKKASKAMYECSSLDDNWNE